MTSGTNSFILCIILLIICFQTGCVTTESANGPGMNTTTDQEQEIQNPAMNPQEAENHSPADISGRGKVVFQDLEGGFYGVISEDGRKFLPASLPERFKTDGMQVTYTFRPQQDAVSFMMWGEPVEIISIE